MAESVNSSLNNEDILAVLRGVIDPELGSDIVDLGMVRTATVDDKGLVSITIALTTAGCPLKAQIKKDVESRLRSQPGVTKIDISWDEMTSEEKTACMAKARWNARGTMSTTIGATTKVVAIASGKGGVGKSSLTVNLAVALAERGMTIGVLDADIGGFSIPRMLNMVGQLEAAEDQDGKRRIVPHRKSIGAGVLEVVSMGFLVENEDSALLWRGQMLNRAVQHFLEDVQWSELDYLFIDLPPGTGDIQMGIARILPQTEMIIVTTPPVAAQMIAARAGDLARKTYLRVAGVIENMSAFICEHGTSYALFGEGGGEALSSELGVPLLGQVPLDASVAAAGDSGLPAVLGSGPAADAYKAIAERIVTEAIPPIELASCTAHLLEHLEEALGPVPSRDSATG